MHRNSEPTLGFEVVNLKLDFAVEVSGDDVYAKVLGLAPDADGRRQIRFTPMPVGLYAALRRADPSPAS